MTVQTELIGGLPELRVISRAMYIMAVETRYATRIHHALNEVVTLHPVLVCSAVGEI
ncbi:MAG TPA: hypothetical protein VN517_10675 [Terriglobales bacterium]|nr:hypothetical protein [Terriglobales bacterium]